jgi:uncharacterized protein
MLNEQEKANIAALNEYYARLQVSDAEGAAAFYAEDLAYWVCPGSDYSGVHSKTKMVENLLPAFFSSQDGPIKFNVISMTAQDDRVHIEATGEMKLKDGGRFDNNYSWLFRLRGGKIINIKEFFTALDA